MAKATPIRGLSGAVPLRIAGPRILAARLRDVERHETRLPAVDAVHDMRVATRRLRAALRLLDLRDADPAAKRLQDALGDIRDPQLQAAWLSGRDDALAKRRQALLGKAQKTLTAALDEWRSRTLPDLLEAAQGKFKGHLKGDRVRKLLRKRLRRLEDRLEVALSRPTPATLHAVRRSVKQIRYLFELAEPAFPQVAKALLSDLAPLQQSLGELHDVDVRLTLLKRSPLLREQEENRERLLAIVLAELSRWHEQGIASAARRSLRQ